jgi:Flp pilus assembly protein TadG
MHRSRMIRPAGCRLGGLRSGTALVETALVLPIFVLIVLGIVEFGRAFMVANLLAEAARQGARSAIVPGSENSAIIEEVKSRVSEMASVSADFVEVEITVTAHPTNADPQNDLGDTQKRDLVNVSVAVPFSKVNVMPIEWLKTTNLRGSCSMRHE